MWQFFFFSTAISFIWRGRVGVGPYIVCSGFTPGGVWKLDAVPRIESGFTSCKARPDPLYFRSRTNTAISMPQTTMENSIRGTIVS